MAAFGPAMRNVKAAIWDVVAYHGCRMPLGRRRTVACRDNMRMLSYYSANVSQRASSGLAISQWCNE